MELEASVLAQLRIIVKSIDDALTEKNNIPFEKADAVNRLRGAVITHSNDLVLKIAFEAIPELELATRETLGRSRGMQARATASQMIIALEAYVRKGGDRLVPASKIEKKVWPVVPNTKQVFIIHGHDEANVLRLKEILKDRFHVEPIVLSDKAEKGRTIIEKFESEADNVAFAFALMTPDDIVRTKTGTVGQARPNVIFELGWFYARLGRQRVCLLFKKGTTIHSDLDGLMRLEFIDSVLEKFGEIEQELKVAAITE